MKKLNLKKMKMEKLEMERESAKLFAKKYSEEAQNTIIEKEKEEKSKIASEYMSRASDLTREIAVRHMMGIK